MIFLFCCCAFYTTVKIWVLAKGNRSAFCRKLCKQSSKVIHCNIHWYHSDQAQLTNTRVFLYMMKVMWDTVNLVAHNARGGTILTLSRGHKRKEARILFIKFLLCTNPSGQRQHTKTWRRLVTRHKCFTGLKCFVEDLACHLCYCKQKERGRVFLYCFLKNVTFTSRN